MHRRLARGARHEGLSPRPALSAADLDQRSNDDRLFLAVPLALLVALGVVAAGGAASVRDAATLDGKVNALSTKDGSILWSARAPGRRQRVPAIDGDTLLVGAGAPAKSIKHPSNELVAYSIR